MRFSAITLFSGAAMAALPGSTEYSTQYFTVTSCPPVVPDCPAESTAVTSTVIPVTMSTVYATEVKTITSCAPEYTECPGDDATVVEVTETVPVSSTLIPVETTLSSVSAYPTSYSNATVTANSPVGGESEVPGCGLPSIKTISTVVNTVIPTVIYETVFPACETETTSPDVPVGTGGGYVSPSAGPTSTPEPVFTAGSSNVGVSVIAAAAGLVAFLA